jgi:nucleoside-triphosphatase THEP1
MSCVDAPASTSFEQVSNRGCQRQKVPQMAKMYLIAGRLRSGKTTLLKQILDKLLGGPHIAGYGFYEECVQRGWRREGYDIVARMGAETMRVPFVRRKYGVSIDGNMFSFDKTAIMKLEQFQKSQSISRLPVLVYFDEFGKLEADGRGLWPLMESLVRRVASSQVPYAVLFSVRDLSVTSLERAVSKSFQSSLVLGGRLVIPATSAASAAFAADIARSLCKKSARNSS